MFINYDLLKSSYDYRHKFYMSKEWRNMREYVLSNEPLCRMCKEEGRLIGATDVDHVRDITERPDLCLEYSNLQSLCKKHHSQKTYHTLFTKKKAINPLDKYTFK